MGYESAPKRAEEAPMTHEEDGELIPLNDAALDQLEERQNEQKNRQGLRKALLLAGVATLQGDVGDAKDVVINDTKTSSERTAQDTDTSEQLPEDVYEVSDGAYATTAPASSLRPKARPDTETNVVDSTPRVEVSTRSTESAIEWGPDSERFKDRVSGFTEWWDLPDRHYQFVDKNTGAPLGEPFGPQEFIVDKRDKMTLIEDVNDPNAYRLTEAEISTWLKFVAQQQGLPESTWEQLNVNAAFEAARTNDREPKLQEGIENGEIQTNLDIVEYFGMNTERTVDGDPENRTYAEYVRDELPKHLDIDDPIVKDEILKYAIGLIAKESRFNNELGKNHATAQQACQLIDAVRVEHLYKEDPNRSDEENTKRKEAVKNRKLTFQEEVEVMGKHLSNIYVRVQHWIGHGYEKVDGEWQQTDRAENLETLKHLYASEEDWKRYGLVPLMLVAYNTGAARVGDMVDTYLNENSDSVKTSWEDEQGYDVYYDISTFGKDSQEGRLAQFGSDGHEYVPMIFAATEAIAKEHPELMRQRYDQLAQN